MTYIIWRARCALHLINCAGYDLRTAWYVSGCFEDWREADPIECADSEISYLTQDSDGATT